MFQHASGIYFEGSRNGSHFGDPPNNGKNGNLEGFLLNRGLFWASNIMSPVFGGSIDIFSEVFGGRR